MDVTIGRVVLFLMRFVLHTSIANSDGTGTTTITFKGGAPAHPVEPQAGHYASL